MLVCWQKWRMVGGEIVVDWAGGLHTMQLCGQGGHAGGGKVRNSFIHIIKPLGKHSSAHKACFAVVSSADGFTKT